MLIFNLHLRKLGMTDAAIAEATGFRFLAILLFSLPVGIYLRGLGLVPPDE